MLVTDSIEENAFDDLFGRTSAAKLLGSTMEFGELSHYMICFHKFSSYYYLNPIGTFKYFFSPTLCFCHAISIFTLHCSVC